MLSKCLGGSVDEEDEKVREIDSDPHLILF